MWFGFGAFSALEPLFFRDVVGVGVEWIGWMNTAFSVGLITGAWLLPRLPTQARVGARARGDDVAVRRGRDRVRGLDRPYGRSRAARPCGGSSSAMTEPLMRTVLHVASPEGYVGRVVGTAQYHRNAGELVPLAFAPALAAAYGVQATLIVGGLLVAAGVLATWPIASVHRPRTRRDRPVHHEPAALRGARRVG